VHRPSFGLDVCDESLVLAVILLGAMYSSDATERFAASAVIEHVESYFFSRLRLSSVRNELRQEDSNVASEAEQEFQIIQAAFTMVITLFWTGNDAQKLRAATELFDIVVEVRVIRAYPKLGQRLTIPYCTECAITRLDDLRTVSRRQTY
jgi:hypothetical protein